MRKVAVVTVIAVLVVALAGSVWAAGGPPASAPGVDRAQKFRQAIEDLKPKLQLMNQHRIRIRELQGEVKGLAAQIRAEIKRIREAGLPFTEEQLEEIKGVTAEMRGFGKTIAETMGQINEQAKLAREARAAQDPEPVKGAYSRMHAVQEARIAHLESLVTAMQAVLAQLQAIQ